MGLYNFRPRFVPFILGKKKRHTIRATRKIRDKVGSTAHLYTGLRTKKTVLLGRHPIIKVEAIEIFPRAGNEYDPIVYIDGVALTKDEREKLARLDGFENLAEMAGFWHGRLPFSGEIIHWNPEVECTA